MKELTQDAPMAQARTRGQTMDTDVYCQKCNHVISVVDTNTIGMEINIHSDGIQNMKCDKCGKKECIALRCYIPNAYDPYDGLRRQKGE